MFILFLQYGEFTLCEPISVSLTASTIVTDNLVLNQLGAETQVSIYCVPLLCIYSTSWYSDGNLGTYGATVAILVSLLDQFKLTVSTGFAGIIVAVSCSVCHTVDRVISLLSRNTPEICCGALPK